MFLGFLPVVHGQNPAIHFLEHNNVASYLPDRMMKKCAFFFFPLQLIFFVIIQLITKDKGYLGAEVRSQKSECDGVASLRRALIGAQPTLHGCDVFDVFFSLSYPLTAFLIILKKLPCPDIREKLTHK